MSFVRKMLFSQSPDCENPKWVPKMEGTSCSVRILLIRDDPIKGRKVIFDSQACVRSLIKDEGFSSAGLNFEQVFEGYGYKYIRPIREDVKRIGELIFGNCPLQNQGNNFKMHILDNDTDFMWSTLFKSCQISNFLSPNVSNSSIGSSIGSNINGFQCDPSYIECSQFDSGIFPSGVSSDFSSFTSDKTNDITLSFIRRRYNSSLSYILPNSSSFYEKASSSDQRELRRNESQGSSSFTSGMILSIPSYKIHSSASFHSRSSTNILDPNKLISNKTSLSTLGIGVIFSCISRHALWSQSFFLQEVLSFICYETMRAYKRRKEFIHIMYELVLEAEKAVQAFFGQSHCRLETTAWALYTMEGQNYLEMENFVNIFCKLRKTLDTKHKNFFLSTFLTGILTYHLGWVDTIIPDEKSERVLEQSKLNSKIRPFSNGAGFWYNPLKFQYLDLHGVVGPNTVATKTVFFSNDDEILKSLLYFTSYFIRCSTVFPITYKDEDQLDDLNQQFFSDYILFQDAKPPKSTSLTSDQSPSQEKEMLRTKKSFILGDSPSPPSLSLNCSPRDKVSFVPSSNAMNEGKKPVLKNSLRVPMGVERDTEKIGLNIPMPRLKCQIDSKPSALPGFFAVGTDYMPGCVAQGLRLEYPLSDIFKRGLYKRLISVSTSLSSFFADFGGAQCLAADAVSGGVEIIFSKKGSLTRNQAQIILAPIVANVLDAASEIASFGPHTVLMFIEDRLKDIYLQSHILAEYLLSQELLDIDTLVQNLDLDFNDIPLLYSVAASHTPEISKKYGLCFQ